MNISQLTATKYPNKKRLGRGIGSGSGKTSGRGTKGQNSRTGGGVKIGFEGGQTKLSMRLPKARGFKAVNPTRYQIINLSDLDKIKTTKIDLATLLEAKIIRTNQPIKLLNNGDISKKVNLTVDAASKKAIEKIEKLGGKVVITPKKVLHIDKTAKIDKSEKI